MHVGQGWGGWVENPQKYCTEGVAANHILRRPGLVKVMNARLTGGPGNPGQGTARPGIWACAWGTSLLFFPPPFSGPQFPLSEK